MALLPIYTYGQPVLRKRAKPVKQVTDELKKFVDDMFETMDHAKGVGLAANQVGSLDRVIVIDVTDVNDKPHEGVGEAADRVPAEKQATGPQRFALINPEIIASSGSWKMEEGCLSIPEIRDEVERPEIVRVRFKDVEGRDQEFETDGFLARVLQHEIDHLNGVLFIDRLGMVKQKLLRGRLNKIQRGEVIPNYPIAIAESIDVSTK
ncbi:MAG: peptide deformylase [Ignavibacteriae bacterium]|nr:peptide deformylase [Ignavibacteriota bacterium]